MLFLNVSGAGKFLGTVLRWKQVGKRIETEPGGPIGAHRISVICLPLLGCHQRTLHTSLTSEKSKLFFAKTNVSCQTRSVYQRFKKNRMTFASLVLKICSNVMAQ